MEKKILEEVTNLRNELFDLDNIYKSIKTDIRLIKAEIKHIRDSINGQQ